MARDNRDRSRGPKGFDKVYLHKTDGTTVELMDYSRFLQNSEARVRQDVVVQVGNKVPAEHVVGKLVDGAYVVGTFKDESVVRTCTAVVMEPFDKPVTISLGTVNAPTKYITTFDATKPYGTVQIVADCTTFIQEGVNDEIIATVAGTDPDGVAGRVAFVFDVNKLGVSTLMPSN